MAPGYLKHCVTETVSLGDRKYLIDRGNSAWRLAAPDACSSSAPPLLPAPWLRARRGHQGVASPGRDIEPLTIVEIVVTGDEPSGRRRVTFEELQGLFDEWQLRDDVWEKGFLKNIYLQPKPARYSHIAINLHEGVFDKLHARYATSHVFHDPLKVFRGSTIQHEAGIHGLDHGQDCSKPHGGASCSAPQGPHFVSITDGRLMPVYRLCEDEYGAFIEGLYSTPDGSNCLLPISTMKLNNLSIAAPSRLGSPPGTPERPLTGLRFSVKDIFKIKGLGPPSLGSRAWVSIRDKQSLESYLDEKAGVEDESEDIIQHLQNMGAVLVGKNGLSEFAFAGPYHWQNTDCLLNFNPRADGLQTPSDSSGASASAVAAYDWLDFAIGTDTGGSIRLPAGANGVYGGRPTTGAIDTSSMQSLARSLDTVGVLARSPAVYCQVLRALLGSSPKPIATSPPRPLAARLKVIVDKDHRTFTKDASLMNTTAPADELFEAFIRRLEESLGVGREFIVPDSLWEDTKQEFRTSQQMTETGELLGSLGGEFGDLYRKIVYWESYRDLGKPFMKAFSAANGGRLPHINNNSKAAWNTIKSGQVSESMYKAALAKKAVLKSWASTYLTEESSPSLTLLVSRGSDQGEDLRDTQSDERYFAPSKPGCVLPYAHLNTLADLPDYRVPIGQFESFSSATGQMEVYPFTACLSVASGGDTTLIELIERLHLGGVLKSVKAGRTAF